MKTLCAVAVSGQWWRVIGDVVCAVLTLEDVVQYLLLLFQVVQLVGCFRAAGLDEVGAEPQRVAGFAHVKYFSCVHDSLLPIFLFYNLILTDWRFAQSFVLIERTNVVQF